MEKIYLNEYLCTTIKEARKAMGMKGLTLAIMMDKETSWVSKIENYKIKSITRDDAKKLESILNIQVYNGTNIELLEKINELMEENKRIKELLMKKWKSE